jgi:hypothetical protein
MSTQSFTQKNDSIEVSTAASSFGLAYAITSVLSALLVVMKETNKGVLDWLAGASPHHWVSHGVLNLFVFFALGTLLYWMRTRLSGKALITSMVGATVFSGLLIVGFYF